MFLEDEASLRAVAPLRMLPSHDDDDGDGEAREAKAPLDLAGGWALFKRNTAVPPPPSPALSPTRENPRAKEEKDDGDGQPPPPPPPPPLLRKFEAAEIDPQRWERVYSAAALTQLRSAMKALKATSDNAL